MMKRWIIICVVCFGWMFFSSTYAINNVDVMPYPIKQDMSHFVDHLEKENIKAMLDDMISLQEHLSPKAEIVKQDPELYLIFCYIEEKEELALACKLMKAALYFQLGDSVQAFKELPLNRGGYGEGYLKSNLKRRTVLCDFIEAYATFEKQIKNYGLLVKSQMGYDGRVDIITDLVGSYATMKRCLGERPYYLRPSMDRVVSCSKNDFVNLLVHLSLIYIAPYGQKYYGDNLMKTTDEALPILLPAVAKGICDMIMDLLPSAFGLVGDDTFNFIARYALDAAIDKDRIILYGDQRELKAYSLLLALSDFGYGEATFQLGVATETHRYRSIMPKLADEETKKKTFELYQKASQQGCRMADVRMGHCLAFGQGCKKDKKRAFQMLQANRDVTNFDKYGSFAYAALLIEGYGDKNTTVLDMMESFATAGCSALTCGECDNACEINAELYEKYYK